jgi:hypothetical protein
MLDADPGERKNRYKTHNVNRIPSGIPITGIVSDSPTSKKTVTT